MYTHGVEQRQTPPPPLSSSELDWLTPCGCRFHWRLCHWVYLPCWWRRWGGGGKGYDCCKHLSWTGSSTISQLLEAPIWMETLLCCHAACFIGQFTGLSAEGADRHVHPHPACWTLSVLYDLQGQAELFNIRQWTKTHSLTHTRNMYCPLTAPLSELFLDTITTL